MFSFSFVVGLNVTSLVLSSPGAHGDRMAGDQAIEVSGMDGDSVVSQ